MTNKPDGTQQLVLTTDEFEQMKRLVELQSKLQAEIQQQQQQQQIQQQPESSVATSTTTTTIKLNDLSLSEKHKLNEIIKNQLEQIKQALAQLASNNNNNNADSSSSSLAAQQQQQLKEKYLVLLKKQAELQTLIQQQQQQQQQPVKFGSAPILIQSTLNNIIVVCYYTWIKVIFTSIKVILFWLLEKFQYLVIISLKKLFIVIYFQKCF